MHFSVIKEDILKYLQYANSFTNPKGLNDILQNIYMEAENNMVNIKATNYQMGFSCNFEVHNVEREGRITVSCRKLLDIIKELPDGALIDFQYDDTRLNVICGKSKFKLSTISSENFPSMGEIIQEYYLKIDSSDLITLLKRTVFCILNDSQKLEYTGAQFTVNRDVLEVSATGMQRVAIASAKFDTEYSNDFTVNIPKKTVSEIIRVFENKGPIEIETDRLMRILETIITQCFEVDSDVKRNKLIDLIGIIYQIDSSSNLTIELNLQIKLEEIYLHLTNIKYNDENRMKCLENAINSFSSNL